MQISIEKDVGSASETRIKMCFFLLGDFLAPMQSIMRLLWAGTAEYSCRVLNFSLAVPGLNPGLGSAVTSGCAQNKSKNAAIKLFYVK